MTLTAGPALGDPEATHVWQAMAAGDWPTARTLITRDGRPHEDRDFLIAVAATVPATERWLPQAIQDGNDDTVALLLLGCRVVQSAWEVAHHPPAFEERLRYAAECLREVARRTPADVTAATTLLTIARCLRQGEDEQRRWFEAAIAADPTNLNAHTQRLLGLTRAWGGSHGAASMFARDTSRRAGEGNRLWTLVARAHIEQWRDLGYDHIRTPEVREHLSEAARESVRSRRYVKRLAWPLDANLFAFAFCLSDQLEAAAMQFLAVGDRPSEYPWHLLGHPLDSFQRARAAINARTAW